MQTPPKKKNKKTTNQWESPDSLEVKEGNSSIYNKTPFVYRDHAKAVSHALIWESDEINTAHRWRGTMI